MYRPLLLAACAAGALLPITAAAQHRHAMPAAAPIAAKAMTAKPHPASRQRARAVAATTAGPRERSIAAARAVRARDPEPTPRSSSHAAHGARSDHVAHNARSDHLGMNHAAHAVPSMLGSTASTPGQIDHAVGAQVAATAGHAAMNHADHAISPGAGAASPGHAQTDHAGDAPMQGMAHGAHGDHARTDHAGQPAAQDEATASGHAANDRSAPAPMRGMALDTHVDHAGHAAAPQGDPGSAGHAAMGHGMAHAGMEHAATFTAPAAWRRASDAALAHAPVGAAMSGMTMGTANGWYSPGSGTARLPAAEGPMRGAMFPAGAWMVMAHGYAWGSVTDQGGPRGADMAFVQSMAMLMADRDLGDRFHVQVRAMGSLEPAMGQRGYPNLFATGETAHGVPLVDRQHPHDLFMELAARVDYRLDAGVLGDDATLFLYGGPVGEPALGPSAFMHRGSARYQPLSPITHHWFDSTHITYGVVTAGVSAPKFQLEGSWFKGREPDERRWDIDPIRLDSWSVRGTWTPSPTLAVQVSHGHLKEPEVQHSGENENRTTASVQWARNGVSTTLAWSRKDRRPGDVLNGYLAEATWEITPAHAVFGRVENVVNDELFPDHDSPLHDRRFRVTKAEAGYAYRLPIVGPLGVALGGTVAAYAKPDALDAAYGDDPVSWTLFAKVALGL